MEELPKKPPIEGFKLFHDCIPKKYQYDPMEFTRCVAYIWGIRKVETNVQGDLIAYDAIAIGQMKTKNGTKCETGISPQDGLLYKGLLYKSSSILDTSHSYNKLAFPIHFCSTEEEAWNSKTK